MAAEILSMRLTGLSQGDQDALRPLFEKIIDAINAPDQYFQVSVAGAAADTNIAITGILTTDTIVSCIEVTVTTAALVDRTAECVILSDGNIQLTTNSTANDFLLVSYRRDATVQITKT